MRKIIIWVIVLALLLAAIPARAQEVTLQKFYLVPVETVSIDGGGQWRGPKYFRWRFDPDPPALVQSGTWSMMDYGFVSSALLLAKDITQADHDALVLNADVYAFPDNLDQPVSDPNIDAFFEAIYLPTDWLTPSTTYRELLRQVAGMMQFNQRYGGIYAERYGGWHSIFDTATLQTRLNQMTAQEREVFLATVASFGYNPALVPTNARLRQLVKSAGNYWVDQPFYMGGVEF